MAARVVDIFEADYERQVAEAASALREGRLVVLPTETVYGAAAALGAGDSAARLRALPPALDGKPMVIHLARREQAMRYLGQATEFERRLMRKLWPGPVGIVFPVPPERQREVAASLGVRAGEIFENDTLTLRCPDHVVASDVLAAAESTVIARRASDGTGGRETRIPENWSDGIDLVIEAGPTRFARPSTLLRSTGGGYEVVRAGVYDQRIIDRLLQTTILFVCSGNTCRSPMAEALARRVLAQRLSVPEDELEKRGVTVLSAGSFAMPGSRATGAAVEAIKALGSDLSRHRSRPLTIELIHQADVIYTMSRGHAESVVAMVPSAADKVMTLDPEGDIADPIGGDLSLYQSLAGQLQALIEKRLEEHPVP